MKAVPRLLRSERNNWPLFATLSLLLLLFDAVFIAINTYSDQRELRRNLQEHSRDISTSFNLTMELTYRNMLELAMFIANDPRVNRLFHEGKHAVEEEGGGAGGPRAAALRRQLYDLVGPNWKKLVEQYHVRQLHFHLGPGSISYLRVHQPEKFGDNMDDVRHIIVDTNQQLKPHTGFETGRVYSGLRGVVPVFAGGTVEGDIGEATGKHIGALEVGASFESILPLLDDTLQGEVVVLLDKAHVEGIMWPEAIKRHFPPANRLPGHYIEALTSNALRPLVAKLDLSQPAAALQTQRLRYAGHHYAATRVPLYDYVGRRDGSGPIGSAVVFSNIDGSVQANRDNLLVNLLYSLIAFVVFELVLFATLHYVTVHLQAVIDSKVHDIEELNASLAEQAITDSLTGLHNHRFFIERLGEEIHKAQRSGQPLALIMLDIDHFKQVNDRYGHQSGDRVLERIAAVLQHHRRAGDETGRYGGEEFCIALPNTDRHGAAAIAERLCSAIAALQIPTIGGEEITVTASLGIAQWDGGESISALIEQADRALYRAKAEGRNRVVVQEG